MGLKEITSPYLSKWIRSDDILSIILIAQNMTSFMSKIKNVTKIHPFASVKYIYGLKG
jgi:hypothetical protein